MSERKGLTRKADRYLESARLLATTGDLDSAVSRAYYAAYFVAATLLGFLSAGDSPEDILWQYPPLEPADSDVCLRRLPG